ncbi:MAG: biotin/lipoate A/B protein ligase family protein [Phycisphaerae bacterium]
MESLRQLIDPPLNGPANMARDEALLAGCDASNARPALRFYTWSMPTISLGYFQDYAEYEALPPPAGGLPVVRRTTGGGAILHDLELTYSLTIPIDHPLIRGRPNRLYELAHRAVIAAISASSRAGDSGVRMLGSDHAACDASAQRGPFFCFARRHGLDVVVDDASEGVSKIAGSAQRRTQGAILQHGSIMLNSRYSQQPVATWSGIAGGIDFETAVSFLLPAFEDVLGMKSVRGEWDGGEIEAARAIEKKYAGDDWTRWAETSKRRNVKKSK